MLYLIGLGLNDEGDLPVKALDALKRCDEVYAELYTSAWKGDLGSLGKIVGKAIVPLKREDVESDMLVNRAIGANVALLIPGDPLTATTHIDLLVRAKKASVGVVIVHASSVYTAVAECGLQLYKFGRTTTLPKFSKGYEPTSPYEIIKENLKDGLHSLVLLDIPMKIGEGLEQLLELENRLHSGLIAKSTKVVACVALGSAVQKIRFDTVAKLLKSGMEEKPACLIVPGKLHFSEEEVLETYKV